MRYKTLYWQDSAVYLLDQTLLPAEIVYRKIVTPIQMHDAIKRLVVRGAPAIGCAAAFGCLLDLPRTPDTKPIARYIVAQADYLMTARPTAVNLFWAAKRMKKRANELQKMPAKIFTAHLLKEAQNILNEDMAQCKKIGEHTLKILPKRKSRKVIGILTHCNAGALATAGTGTALAGIYLAARKKINVHVYADETRPLLQGARLTAWELTQAKIPVTLLCDNMAAKIMSEGKIDCVIVGADRIVANGDAANKIGTLGVAILAQCFGIPFYVVAPTSSFDLTLKSGREIPIEQRDGDEVRKCGEQYLAPKNVDVYNPAFDMTPVELISAIITERGVIKKPTTAAILKHFKS